MKSAELRNAYRTSEQERIDYITKLRETLAVEPESDLVFENSTRALRLVVSAERLPKEWQETLKRADEAWKKSQNPALKVGAAVLDSTKTIHAEHNTGKGHGHAEIRALGQMYDANIPNRIPLPQVIAVVGTPPDDRRPWRKNGLFDRHTPEEEVLNAGVVCCQQCIGKMQDFIAQVPDVTILSRLSNGQVYVYTRNSADPTRFISRSVPADWYKHT